MKKDQMNTMHGTDLGSSVSGFSEADLARGFCDAGPRGNYEGSLDPTVTYDYDEHGDMIRLEGGTKHPGMLEPDMFKETHGALKEYGLVRRPERRSDVERN